MGARASRRRHEGRRIRKFRRIWGGVSRGFLNLSISASHTTKVFNRLVEVWDTPSGSIATAQRPDGTVLVGIDPGTSHPSQTGVEAVRSTHSAAEMVDAAAAEMGLRLLPWQRDAAIAAVEGKPFILVGGKQCGRTTVLQVVERARGLRADYAWVDEVQ